MPLQPRAWLSGLLPLALLAGGSLWWKQADIERDLGNRAAGAIAAAGPTVDGKPWAAVSMAGRDATITGEAPATDAQASAARVADAIFGVRRAAMPTGLLPAANPFGWSARRDGQTMTLSGQVAPDGSRDRIVAAARAALPGGEVVDQMTTARDVPAHATAAALIGLQQLGRVANGSTALIGSTFSFAGNASDQASQALITAALAALPQGVSRGAVRVSAPPPPTLSAVAPAPPVATAPAPEPPPAAVPPPVAAWNASKTAEGITLTGTVASEAARTRILAAARAATSGQVIDRMTVAAGLPEVVEAKAIAALGQISQLANGTAAIADRVYSLTGVASTPVAFDTIARAQDPADGFSIGSLAIAPPAVSPFTWSAAKREGVLTLSGFAPSAAAKATVLAQATAVAGRARIVDEMRIASGLAAGVDYGGVTGSALGQLAKLTEGTARLSDSAFALAGQAPSFEIASGVRQAVASLAAPLTASSDITLPPAEIPAPAEEPPLAADLSPPPPPPPAPPSPVVAPSPAGVGTAAPAPGSAMSGAPVSTAGPMAATTPPPAPRPWPDCMSLISTALEGDRILFDYWKAEQRAEHAPVLDRLVAALGRCDPAVRVEVAGHTDIRNLTNSNQQLSEDRAVVIRGELMRRGIAADRLVVVGHAASRPVVPNDNEANMALNRRVEFAVLPRS
ncbi:OmpA family protein [Phreatobacter stygius]|uniref:OmpA family protein n=1 Tax=Phreatobacter stygius TaxID=1940610 RepID=A0A4D7B2R6_9HYPH|nr:OmpA family protein [Phreatobacter stygius]QCI63826.1 OmpA family protein [Phreatobacter stygius]